MPDFDGTGPLGRDPRMAGRRGRRFLPATLVMAEEETAPVIRGGDRGTGLWGCVCGFRGGRGRHRR